MTAKALVQAHVDETTEGEASAVLATMGRAVFDAPRLLLTRATRDEALPFAPLIPNAETVAAVNEAPRGKLAPFSGVDACDRGG
jgi:DNA-damage-inducible protein J